AADRRRSHQSRLGRLGSAARALLHDGRLLRVPGHRRWHRQSARLPYPGACRHADRDPARPAGDRPMTEIRAKHDVAAVGAGPAGLAAATICARAKLTTVLFDEQPSPGGQIYRAITTTPVRRDTIFGPDFWSGAGIAQAFLASGADYVPGATVW